MTVQRALDHEQLWRRYDAEESRLSAPLSERMLDLARLAPGMRVLDLATGRGEPALRAAERVGPGGLVVGIDPSAALLQMAREKASQKVGEQAGPSSLAPLELHAIEAEALASVAPPAHFDVATVRWGLMYMRAPVAALAATRRALKPDGVLVAALWGPPELATYYSLPRRVLARYRTIPGIDEGAPGTFHYADPERLRRDLDLAGLAIDHSEEMYVPVIEADSDAGFVAWVRALGLTRLLDELPEHEQLQWEQDLLREAESHRRGGKLQLGGVTRLVVARAAG